MVAEESYEVGDVLIAESDTNTGSKILTISGTSDITWILDLGCTFHICL